MTRLMIRVAIKLTQSFEDIHVSARFACFTLAYQYLSDNIFRSALTKTTTVSEVGRMHPHLHEADHCRDCRK